MANQFNIVPYFYFRKPDDRSKALNNVDIPGLIKINESAQVNFENDLASTSFDYNVTAQEKMLFAKGVLAQMIKFLYSGNPGLLHMGYVLDENGETD
jgi:hypothetical protein